MFSHFASLTPLGKYCSFGKSPEECKKWLLKNDSQLFSKIYGGIGTECFLPDSIERVD